MKSVWSDESDKNVFDSLKEDIKTDVLIIGGGMSGVLTAYFLDKAGINYALVEADRIGNGITKNTTAKITSQHGLIYDKLIKYFGKEKAKMYLDANQEALNKYKTLCKEIKCDFEDKDSYVYSRSDIKKVKKEIIALEKLGFDAEFCSEISLPISIVGAVKFKNQAQFNPLKFISGISKGLNIFEKTKVLDIRDHLVITSNGNIEANKIIVTTHFPFINKHGLYFIKMYQHRSYVIAYENAPDINGMYVDEAEKGMSFRNYNNLLLIGGGDHRTGKNGGNFKEIESFAHLNFKNSKEKYRWATQDCMTLDGVPYIGAYSKNTKDLYVATGFNKWGMTSSMVSAMILSNIVQGKNNQYAPVFSPSRSILRPQLLANMFEAIISIITPSKKRCPHLGCALKWNKVEHTWDCPCHGSRFQKDGKLIDNPSTGDLKK